MHASNNKVDATSIIDGQDAATQASDACKKHTPTGVQVGVYMKGTGHRGTVATWCKSMRSKKLAAAPSVNTWPHGEVYVCPTVHQALNCCGVLVDDTPVPAVTIIPSTTVISNTEQLFELACRISSGRW